MPESLRIARRNSVVSDGHTKNTIFATVLSRIGRATNGTLSREEESFSERAIEMMEGEGGKRVSGIEKYPRRKVLVGGPNNARSTK